MTASLSSTSGPPLTEIVATSSSSSSAEEDRKTHIEVCVRIRPLKVQNESSTSFLSCSSSSSTSCTSARTKNTNIHTTTSSSSSSGLPRYSKLVTPPRNRSSAIIGRNNTTASSLSSATPGSDRKGNNNNNNNNNNTTNNNANDDPTNESNETYAWNVTNHDTVQQNPDLENLPGRTTSYTLDHVYGPDATTQQLFDQSVLDLVKASMDGYHASILAYGQTSTGKTHTMTGTAAQPGLIPLSIRGCFDYLKNMLLPREYLLRLSYMEVYKEHIRDLLGDSNSTPIRLFDTVADGLVIKGLREEVVTSPEQVFALLAEGESRRQVGATHMNAHSSRSHVIVRLWIESRALPDGGGGMSSHQQPQRFTSTASSNSSLASSSRLGPNVRVSSLSLVDLAGSESVKLTGNNDRRQEGHYINQSLMTLGKVVYALSEIGDSGTKKSIKQQHIPYRDSKLTRLLQPSLSGNAQLMLVCCISPLAQHVEESHNTFKFATRAKKIPQKATIQEAPDERTLLQSYRDEIEDLKQQLRDAEEAKKLLLQQGSPSSTGGTPRAPATQQLMASDDVVSEDEIQELVSSIQTMEKLILKSKPITPVIHHRPEDLIDSEDWDDYDIMGNVDDEEDLLALATTKSEGATSASTSVNTPATRSVQPPPPIRTSPTDDTDTNLQIELSRIQGLLGSVLKKRKTKQQLQNQGPFFPPMRSASMSLSDQEVAQLRAQLEQQEVATSIRKADSSFLQKQLEEKDDLLMEVSKILEAVEQRQAQLEQENAALRREVAALRRNRNNLTEEEGSDSSTF